MKVYIELFVIDNIVTSTAAAWLSYAFFGMRIRKARTAAAVAAGLAESVIYPFVSLPAYIVVPAKLISGILLSEILFCGLKKTFPSASAFFASTALIGGTCFAVSCFASGTSSAALNEAYSLPYLVPSVIAFVVALPTKFLIDEARKKYTEMKFRCEAEVTVENKTAKLVGFIDSGNGLTDNGLPIAIIKMTVFTEAFGTDVLYHSAGIKRAVALGGSGESLILIKPDKIRLYYGEKANTYKDVMLGVSALGFNREEDMLLPSSVLGG